MIKKNKIPDSNFKKELMEFGLIEKERINKITTNELYNKYMEYKEDINENNDKIILGEFNIESDDINEDIQIINSFENNKRKNKWDSEEDEEEEEDDSKYENEGDIKENIEIKINEKNIGFSYVHKFEKEGRYKIKYIFKKNLSNLNHLFCRCENLININLSNFNTNKVTDMSYIFEYCSSLTDFIKF